MRYRTVTIILDMPCTYYSVGNEVLNVGEIEGIDGQVVVVTSTLYLNVRPADIDGGEEAGPFEYSETVDAAASYIANMMITCMSAGGFLGQMCLITDHT